MTQAHTLITCGRHLGRAFDLLERADELHFPSHPEIVTKQGLLDEARREIARAEALLEH